MANDPSMLGQTRYPRAALDHYPTPARATEAFVTAFKGALRDSIVWEPACGNGAIVKVVQPYCEGVVGTDIQAYEGYDPAALIDFLALTSIDQLEEQTGVRPNAIITNPPYGDLAEAFAWKAIELMEPVGGWVALLCRHEWDAAKGRAKLFDHRSFDCKLTLRFRPRWIEGSSGAPRFPYSWYVWNQARDDFHGPSVRYAG